MTKFDEGDNENHLRPAEDFPPELVELLDEYGEKNEPCLICEAQDTVIVAAFHPPEMQQYMGPTDRFVVLYTLCETCLAMPDRDSYIEKACEPQISTYTRKFLNQ